MIKIDKNIYHWLNFSTNPIIGPLAFASSTLTYFNKTIYYFSVFFKTFYYNIKQSKNYINFFLNLKNENVSKSFNCSFSENKFEFLVFASLFYLFCSYIFLGSSNISFSNEGIWLLVLSTVVVFANLYYKSKFSQYKSSFEVQIDSITKLLSRNAELVQQIGELEVSLLSAQQSELNNIESFYIFIDNLELNSSNYVELFEIAFNKTFQDHIYYLVSLTLFRENAFFSFELRDLNEEIVEEGFEV